MRGLLFEDGKTQLRTIALSGDQAAATLQGPFAAEQHIDEFEIK